VSCPYFEVEDLPSVDKYVKDVVVGGSRVSRGLLVLVKMLLASVYCHFEFLRENLHMSNRLRSIPLFMAPPEELLKGAVYKYPWEMTDITPRLTGIPPHVTMLTKMDTLLKNQDAAADSLMAQIKQELDERNMGGGYNAVTLMNFFENTKREILDKIHSVEDSVARMESEDSESARQKRFLACHPARCWGGKLQAVPEDWQFPRAAFFGSIVIWHMGASKDQIPALKLLKSTHFEHLKRGPKKFRDLKKLQDYVERAARETNSWRPQGDWNEQKLHVMYKAIKPKFNFTTKRGKATRFDQLSWETILDKLKKNKYNFA